MINLIVALLSSRIPIPIFLIDTVFRFLNKSSFLLNGRALWNRTEYNALIAAIGLTKLGDHQIISAPNPHSFTLIFVATSKDISVLPTSLTCAVDALRNHSLHEIVIYVPDRDIEALSSSLKSISEKVQVKSENSFFPFSEISTHFNSIFEGRGNWCVQQILKVHAVMNCKTEYAMVVDADTLLLRERPWVDVHGRTLLNPSLEYHVPYYDVLQKIGVQLRKPALSFVPHHMVYDVFLFNRYLQEFRIQTIEDLKSKFDFLNSSFGFSPFCIDYELYGQREYQQRGETLILTRWANISISSTLFRVLQKFPIVRNLLKVFFNSISIHNRVAQ